MTPRARKYARTTVALLVAILLLTLLTGTAAAQTFHVVQPGDTLSGIAVRYNVTMYCLATANGIGYPYVIYIGQTLYIPEWGSCGGGYYYYFYASAMGSPSWMYACYHRVSYGETLYSVARRYGTTFWNLAYANHLYNPNYIYAGQILRIPGCN